MQRMQLKRLLNFESLVNVDKIKNAKEKKEDIRHSKVIYR